MVGGSGMSGSDAGSVIGKAAKFLQAKKLRRECLNHTHVLSASQHGLGHAAFYFGAAAAVDDAGVSGTMIGIVGALAPAPPSMNCGTSPFHFSRADTSIWRMWFSIPPTASTRALVEAASPSPRRRVPSAAAFALARLPSACA
jgi:hypothetical protein